MANEFLVGVADARYFSSAEELIFSAKTMLDTSIEISTDSTDVRGGKSNPLLFIYFHTPEMSITLTEAQFNLGMIAANVGSEIITGTNVWKEETVIIGAGGVGEVDGTPLVTPDGTTSIYGWVTEADGTTTRVAFTGKEFTLGSEDDTVCVYYYLNDTSAKEVTIPSNFVPSVGRLVLDAGLGSSDGDASGSSIIGKVEIEIPRFQLSGASSIEMTSSGVANTPLSGMALAYRNTSGGCSSAGDYAKIRKIVDNANWYDDVTALAILDNGALDLTHPDTATLSVKAVHTDGGVSDIVVADCTFTSGTVGTATIGANTGVITTVAAGTSLLTCTITAKTTVYAKTELTVS